jgi:hypothetical protein
MGCFQSRSSREARSRVSRRRLHAATAISTELLPRIDETPKLCEVCSALDIKIADFVPDGKGLGHRNLLERTLEAFKASRGCALCSCIAYAIECTRPEWQVDEVKPDDAVVCKVRLEEYSYPSSKPISIIGIITNFPFHGPSYGMQLFPVVNAGFNRSLEILMGRPVSQKGICLPLVNAWIQECCENHDATCEIKDPEFGQTASEMFVMDVEDECITSFRGLYEHGAKYVALSYVWGQCKSIQLNRGNKEALTTPGGLAAIFRELPRVIQDAI